jgi:type II secretory pathway pseudopilin PulG
MRAYLNASITRTRDTTRAFTLIEVTLASTLLALGLVGAIQVILSGREMLDVASKQSIAVQIIRGQMEQLRLADWNKVSALGGSATAAVDAADQTSNINAGFVFGSNLPAISATFQCTRTIADVRTDMKQITFTVTWHGYKGRTFSRSAATYFGRNGLYVSYQGS